MRKTQRIFVIVFVAICLMLAIASAVYVMKKADAPTERELALIAKMRSGDVNIILATMKEAGASGQEITAAGKRRIEDTVLDMLNSPDSKTVWAALVGIKELLPLSDSGVDNIARKVMDLLAAEDGDVLTAAIRVSGNRELNLINSSKYREDVLAAINRYNKQNANKRPAYTKFIVTESSGNLLQLGWESGASL
jgi:F420-0:gamma-glutamyl ligase-like protein